MKSTFTIFLFSLILQVVQCTTITFKLDSAERACYYLDALKEGEKIAFYYAVQAGGNFDVDYDVMDPKGNAVMKANAERQGDYVFIAKHVGEYTFCFSNAMSTFAEKTIDLDLTVEHEVNEKASVKSALVSAVGPTVPSTAAEKLVKKLVEDLSERLGYVEDNVNMVSHEQRFVRTQEHRDISLVLDIENRMFWFALLEGCFIVGTAVIQVSIIKSLFSKNVRTRI